MSITLFSLTSTGLLSLTEGYVPRFCDGRSDICDGDELAEDEEKCRACRNEAVRQERRAEDLRDWLEEAATLKRTQHSRFEDEDEARLFKAVKATEHLPLSLEEMKRRVA